MKPEASPLEIYRLLADNGLSGVAQKSGVVVRHTFHGGLKLVIRWSTADYHNWPVFTPAEREEAHKGLRLAQKVLEDNGYEVTPVEQTGGHSFAGLTHLLIPVEQE